MRAIHWKALWIAAAVIGLLVLPGPALAQQVDMASPLVEAAEAARDVPVASTVKLLVILTGLTFVPAMLVAALLAGMLLAGYKAKVAAVFQAALLAMATFYAHSFFRLASNHWERDLHQYYFFQLLTVTGAMLLIASRGAGRFSMDHNKKFG